MAASLSGARLKLARAEEHFGELRLDHNRYLQRNPYRALRETDVEPHCFLWRIKIVEQPPVERWAALAGDCVHNLRSALDHTAYELVRINQPTTEKCEFPIFKNRSAWKRDYAKKLPGVSPKVVTQAKWLQPYRRLKLDDPLWLVHELDIIDKHRRLGVVTSALGVTESNIVGGEVIVTDPCLGPFVDGAVVGRFKIVSEEGADVRMETKFGFDIAFGEGEPTGGKPVITTLEWLRVYVGGVISRFERFF